MCNSAGSLGAQSATQEGSRRPRVDGGPSLSIELCTDRDPERSGYPRGVRSDSGGYQIFSLAPLCKVSEDGVTFQSHLDGSLHHVTPETAIEIQEALGSDIAMILDECLRHPATREAAEASLRRTNAWARRCRETHHRSDQALFGIVQGGHYPDLRARAAAEVAGIGFDGYALGGLSVGEDKATMN